MTLFSYCDPPASSDPDTAFYHWRSDARFTPVIERSLEKSGSEEIYMHYFDVDHPDGSDQDSAYPEFVLRKVDDSFKDYEVVPVVFIANRVFEKGADPNALSDRIERLVNEIHRHHFEESPERIQFDCDWNQSTRPAFFELLKELKGDYALEATLRLHQIKYKERTGIPPVDRGTLMLYNMGELDDLERNAILEPGIVADYIGPHTKYPLDLDLALPLFGQTRIRNDRGDVKLIDETLSEELVAASGHFEQVGDGHYKVSKDTLFEGFYLYEGFELKVDSVSRKKLLRSWETVRNSELAPDRVIFFHLKDEVLKKKEIPSLIEAL